MNGVFRKRSSIRLTKQWQNLSTQLQVRSFHAKLWESEVVQLPWRSILWCVSHDLLIQLIYKWRYIQHKPCLIETMLNLLLRVPCWQVWFLKFLIVWSAELVTREAGFTSANNWHTFSSTALVINGVFCNIHLPQWKLYQWYPSILLVFSKMQ